MSALSNVFEPIIMMFGSFLPSLGRQQPKSTRVEGADIVYAIKWMSAKPTCSRNPSSRPVYETRRSIIGSGRIDAPDAALMRGDNLRAQQPADAVTAYREALRLAPGQLAAPANRRNLIRRGAARQ
jgi:hypothetical protein